ncbi:hypothetical protein BDR03DRAFT_972997 [Suillus americanus]|nr:hypothetical protein BDR03DRAFT_972997 [Suillus americanus]
MCKRRDNSAAHLLMCMQHVTSGSLADELASLSMIEQEILHSLTEGRGITQYDGNGLLESCRSCQQCL